MQKTADNLRRKSLTKYLSFLASDSGASAKITIEIAGSSASYDNFQKSIKEHLLTLIFVKKKNQ